MKRSDIIVGQEYAYSRHQPYEGQRCDRVVIVGFVTLPGLPTRFYRPNPPQNLIEVRFPDGKTPDEVVRVETSREIRWPWSEELSRCVKIAAKEATQADADQACEALRAVLVRQVAAAGVNAEGKPVGVPLVHRTSANGAEIHFVNVEQVRALTALLSPSVEVAP